MGIPLIFVLYLVSFKNAGMTRSLGWHPVQFPNAESLPNSSAEESIRVRRLGHLALKFSLWDLIFCHDLYCIRPIGDINDSVFHYPYFLQFMRPL